ASTNCLAAVPNVSLHDALPICCSATNAITVMQNPAAGTLVGLGPHVITVTATDAAGNSATCTTTFTVIDNMAPTLNCPAPTSAGAGRNCLAAAVKVTGRLTATD